MSLEDLLTENSDDDDWTVAAGLAGDPDNPYNVGPDMFEAFFDSDTRVTRTAEMLQALCSRLSAEISNRIAAAEADNTLALPTYMVIRIYAHDNNTELHDNNNNYYILVR
jgi:hypothetical protein